MSTRDLLDALADHLESRAPAIGRLDAVAGDGDLGITTRTLATVCRGLSPTDPPSTLRTAAMTVAERAPSTFGTLLAGALLRAAGAIDTDEVPTVQAVQALEAAALAVAERGKVSLGERTMLDALQPAATAAGRVARNGGLEAVWTAAAGAAHSGAEQTASMRALHGRAGWIADRADGVEDAGARLVAEIFAGLAGRSPDDHTSDPSETATADPRDTEGDPA